ncbi:MAG: hypothetical protein PUE12_06365 [Oscillospiraceae bacterium]|nr:hypothetical protein [Oscillospiraceae bacterium]
MFDKSLSKPDSEFHSGLYFRKYKGDNSASLGLELLFDTVQKAAEYVKDNYPITEENISYHIEDTYGICYAIITNDKIDYV